MAGNMFRKKLSIAVEMLGIAMNSEKGMGLTCRRVVGTKVVRTFHVGSVRQEIAALQD